tara:strand:- start:912 stop:2138 length:1227 start_codon:yes stop_codon:yes gene_type:complete
MNKYTKIFLLILFVLSFIILVIFGINSISNFKNTVIPKEINNERNLNYLTMTEQDFDKLEIYKRWYYRSYCLNLFDKIKHNYSLRKFVHPPKSERNNLIFVNLASYRDPECHKTIKSLIFNSYNWKNLRIVVCEQNSEEDIPYNYKLDSKYKNIIKVIKMNYKNARGPTLARFLIQQLYNKEEYYLQIDSHTLFEKNWDLKLINTINNLPYKSCLTQYLPDYEIGSFTTKPKLRGELLVSQICALDGFTRINAKYLDINNNYSKPFKSNGWSGCFSFSRGDICYDAPIDCYTPDVFFGEEMDIALRLFTRGWNFYSPNYPIAYTNFNRKYRDTFWEKKGLGYDKNITLCSRLRIHYRLGTLPRDLKEKIEKKYPELIINHNLFQLGNIRNLNDYQNLIGYNFSTETHI